MTARFLMLLSLGMCLRAGNVLYTNLGLGDSYTADGLGVGSPSTFVVGTMFTATGTGNLMQIKVPIADSNGSVTLGLYTNSGGLPGTLLEGWTNLPVSSNNLALPIPLVTVKSVVNPAVTAGSVYWFVAISAGTNVSANQGLEWDQSTQISTGGMWIGTSSSLSSLTPSYTNGPPLAIELDSTAPGAVTVFSPAQGATGVSLTTALTWAAATAATSYDVYLGTSPLPPLVTNITGNTYTPAALNPNTTYYWYLISKNAAGSTPSAVWSFTTGASSHPDFFNGESSLGSAVYYLLLPGGNLFGYYSYLPNLILYHFDMGYEAIIPSTGSAIYFYDFATGHWWYSSASLFPYMYDFTLNAWVYYFSDTKTSGHYTTNPRYFSNLTTGKIFTM